MIKKIIKKIFIGDESSYKIIPLNLLYVTIALLLVLIIKSFYQENLTFTTLKNNFGDNVLFPLLGYSIGYIPIAVTKIYHSKERR